MAAHLSIEGKVPKDPVEEMAGSPKCIILGTMNPGPNPSGEIQFPE